MSVKDTLGDGQVLQDLVLQRCAEPFGFFDPVILGGSFELGERTNVQNHEEAQHLFGPQAGHGQHFENAGFLSKRTSPWMAEGAAARLARE
jgi:hypothetical protein